MALRKNDERHRLYVVELTSKSGTFIVPVGQDPLLSCNQSVKKEGVLWLVASRGDGRTLNVLPKSVYHLEIGPPCTASVKVQQAGKNVAMDLALLGRGKDTCVITSAAQSKPPQFLIRPSRAGCCRAVPSNMAEVAHVRYSGGISPKVKGTVIVRPVIQSGPFEVKIKDTTWTRK